MQVEVETCLLRLCGQLFLFHQLQRCKWTPATISLRMKCFTYDPPFVVEHRAGTQLEEPLRDQYLLDWLIPYSIGNKELPCRLMAIPRPQLGKDMGEVIFHCLWTDVETYTDLLVAHPVREERENGEFLATQLFEVLRCVTLGMKERAEHTRGQMEVDPDTPSMHRNNRSAKVSDWRCFGDIAVHATHSRFNRKLLFGLIANDENFCCGTLSK